MAIITAATPLATTAPAQFPAFHFPANLVDGTYQASFDADGQEVHKLISTTVVERATALASPQAPTSAKRQATPDNMHCGCGYNLDHGNCDAAVQGLKDQVGGGAVVPPSASFYTIVGNVVAFICTSGMELGQYVDTNTITSDLQYVTNACRWYVAGTFDHGNWGPYNVIFDYNLGYMQYFGGLDFCGAADGSSSGSC